MDLEIVKTDTPRRDLLLLADESEESVADYAGRGTTYVARRDGEILGQYVFLHTRPFTAEVVNIPHVILNSFNQFVFLSRHFQIELF